MKLKYILGKVTLTQKDTARMAYYLWIPALNLKM